MGTVNKRNSLDDKHKDYSNGRKPSSKQFDWEKQWYPLAVEEFTDKKKSHAMMFLGNNVVLWHNGEKWSVFEDACPHRGVPLSEGRVESNGELLCSYHAWTFNGEGECTSIPQTLTKEKEKTLLSKACVKSYPVQVRQGLVWVWGSKGAPGSDVAIEASLKSLPIPEELEDPAMKDRISTPGWNFRDLPYGWDMFMENVFDPAHVPVSHHKITGDRYKDALPLSIRRVKASTEIPVAEGGKMKPGHEEDAGFKFEIKTFRDGRQVGATTTNEFVPPCLNHIDSLNPDGSRLNILLYATPTKPGYCRHVGAQFLIKGKDYKKPKGLGFYALPIPKWLLHPLANLFLVKFSHK